MQVITGADPLEFEYALQAEFRKPQYALAPCHYERDRVVCHYWIAGRCVLGDGCDFAHHLDGVFMPKTVHKYAAHLPRDLFAHRRLPFPAAELPDALYEHVPPCLAWHSSGSCRAGERCTLRHGVRAPEPAPAPAPAPAAGPGAEADEERPARGAAPAGPRRRAAPADDPLDD